MVSERSETFASFPGPPQSVTIGRSLADLTLRPFGTREIDLAIDFEDSRPFVVTQILASCTGERQGRTPEAEFFWRLPVGTRIECLLALVRLEIGTEIPFRFNCPNAQCGQQLEVEISVDELAAEQSSAYETEFVRVVIEQEEVCLRRPIAADQREWLASSFPDEPSALRAMVGTLLLDQEGQKALENKSLAGFIAVEQAMDLHDPLVNFTVLVNCSACGTEHSLGIDLEELSLRHLRRAQSRLLASVHTLAVNYHWSEPQIFAVPSWRRALYLSLIEKEIDQ